jgi:hypothetical protein
MTCVDGTPLCASVSSLNCSATLAQITASAAIGMKGRGLGLPGLRHTAVSAIRKTQMAASAALPSASEMVKRPKYRPASATAVTIADVAVAMNTPVSTPTRRSRMNARKP